MDKKIILLIVGIVFDIIGYATYAIPFFGESADFIWAPISALAMFVMYKGAKGIVGGIFGGLEEILPFTDFIPSFTLMWVYTYFIEKKKDGINK